MKKLAERATPGPWEVANTERIFVFTKGRRGEDDFVADTGPEDDEMALPNAAYLAAVSPDVVLALVERVAELEEALRKLIDEMAETYEDMAAEYGRKYREPRHISDARTALAGVPVAEEET